MQKLQHNSNWYFIILSFFIFILAVVARFYLIELRPLHHDEGVNFHFLQEMNRLGFYPYSHENYHGPSFFYALWLVVKIFGDSEAALRTASILFGLACTLTPFLLIPYLGRLGALVAQFFISFATASLYISRYAIHESCFLLFTLLAIIFLFKYFENKRTFDFVGFSVAVAGLIITKETYIITLAVLALASIIVFNLKLKSCLPRIKQFNLALASFLLIILVFYTGFFTSSSGLLELFQSVPQWMDRNRTDEGHHKAWGYYLTIIFGSKSVNILTDTVTLFLSQIAYLLYLLSDKVSVFYLAVIYDFFTPATWNNVNKALEFYIFGIFILIPLVIYALYKSRDYLSSARSRFFVFILIVSVALFSIYSFPIDYKTPWLIINITIPLALLIGSSFNLIYSYWRDNIGIKSIACLLLVWMMFVCLKSSWHYNYEITHQAANPLAYAHTHESIRDISDSMIKQINKFPDQKSLVAVGSYWPLPYYIREHKSLVEYLLPKNFQENCENLNQKYSSLVLDRDLDFKCPGWYSRYFRLGQHQELRVWYRS